MFIFQEHVPKIDSFANVLDSKELLSISRFPGFQNVSFSSIPGSQVIRMDRFPVFPGSQVIKMNGVPILELGTQKLGP